MTLTDAKRGIGSQLMASMEVEEMVVLDNGLGILFFFEEGLAALHNDVRIVVLLDRIPEKNRLVRSAEGLLRRLVSALVRARTTHEQAKHDDGQDEPSSIACHSAEIIAKPTHHNLGILRPGANLTQVSCSRRCGQLQRSPAS
ncbi:protein of unknown function [Nitrospira japonica]|uniref:Uncharacterized protein n=1 Tax=Nitrospira japonica TaxID=1325564 RepID=A0A1W1I4Q3_9BACT|nr:protein of unknown function [Nitrospira japonica]